jgi:predicted metal-dependent enzyme (double-stranded beta helix superfamily)
MAYTLDEFCTDCRTALKHDPGEGGHEAIRQKLEKLLKDSDFVAANCGPDAEAGIRTVYRDPETDFNVLVHVYDKGKTGPPHDHGTSWGVYGQAVGHTDMTMWDRTDGGTGEGPAEILSRQEICLNPGMAAKVEIGDIHSIRFPDGARFVRVTGTDLDAIPTLCFDPDNKTATIGSRLNPLPG